jgi:diaminopimelate epimerase
MLPWSLVLEACCFAEKEVRNPASRRALARLALPEDCGNDTRMLRFSKMNGAGNDFVMIDNRVGDLHLAPEQIAKICDRHRGVGADGVLVLERATNGADFRMRYYNADGGEAEMCGNGARCFARYASRVAGPKEELSFETPAGVIGAKLQGELVRLAMSDPQDLGLGIAIHLPGRQVTGHFVNSGVPHLVVPIDDLEGTDVRGLGSAIRRHQLFAPKGANVNFLKERSERQIAIRTYERGVEDETLACGTGVVASALIFAELKNISGPIGVLVRGGNELQVGFDKSGGQYRNVTLTGPADFVFDGTIEV